jgi:hypothetical protein
VLRKHSVGAVADVKYKLLDEQGRFPNADGYQLVTYCSRFGLSGPPDLGWRRPKPRPAPGLTVRDELGR